MDKMQKCLNDRLAEIADLHRKNTGLYQKISELEEAYLKEKQRNKPLEEQSRSSRKREEKARQELKTVQQSLEEARKEMEDQRLAAEQEIETLRRRITQMEQSKSWKITKPLRAFLWKVKGVQ